MKTARITDPQACQVLAELGDDVVSAVQKEEEMAREIAEVDALLEEIERELAADERLELVRVTRDATDQVRARRTRRRSDRAALRVLPVQLRGGAAAVDGKEAA